MDEAATTGVSDGNLPLTAQPAIAARTRSLVRVVIWGLVLGVVGAAGFLAASILLVRFSSTTRLWPAVGNIASILLVVISALQLFLWRSGLAEWEGRRDVALGRWLWISKSAALFSSILLVATAVACLQIVFDTSAEEASYWLAIVGGAGSMLAYSMAARFAFDPAGPPSVPAYLLRNLR
ncbi:MAG TPA: hypothetical protein VLR88_08620 [Propionibacteriaceae bacterium]|nr:hypothetical protein [Propionibacteriaceae bacterium]